MNVYSCLSITILYTMFVNFVRKNRGNADDDLIQIIKRFFFIKKAVTGYKCNYLPYKNSNADEEANMSNGSRQAYANPFSTFPIMFLL